MARAALIALCVVALGAAGCGRAADRREAGAVTERFLRAVDAHDGARACAQLSDATVQALEQDAGKPCAEAVKDLKVSASAVTHAEVDVIGAKVDLADGHSTFLELGRSGWRLSAAGCQPGAGDEPYTCEVQD
jgi:hypothetical protein